VLWGGGQLSSREPRDDGSRPFGLPYLRSSTIMVCALRWRDDRDNFPAWTFPAAPPCWSRLNDGMAFLEGQTPKVGPGGRARVHQSCELPEDTAGDTTRRHADCPPRRPGIRFLRPESYTNTWFKNNGSKQATCLKLLPFRKFQVSRLA